jgi:hypothetical protein
MSDIQKGDTFVDGQTVTGARLNALVDSAIILAAFISGKAQVVPVGGDHLVIYQASSGQLKKALVSALPFVTSVGLSMPSSVFDVAGSPITGAGTITVTFDDQTANKFLASPDGSTGQPSFRQIGSQDDCKAPVAIAANDIDWTLGWVFQKTITGVFTPTFSNTKNGQTIRVFIQQGGGGTIVWSIANLKWPAGTPPAQINATNNRVDLYEFTHRATNIYGRFFQNYF